MSRRAGATGQVALAAFAWLAALAWARPLMLPDEGRYVGVAWEMLRSGDWLTPTINGLPYFHKPPLFYWVTAASLSVFGVNDLSARAAPLLGAWTAAMALFVFARRWWGADTAGLALVALLAQPLFYVGGQFANLDMLVTGCITASIVLFSDTALRVERGDPDVALALHGAYAAAGLGVLAKGLIGVVIPALTVCSWLLARRRWRTLVALVSPTGALLLLGVAAPWFLTMEWQHRGFLDYFFVVQHFRRFAAGGFNNVQPAWFYPALLAVFLLPWLASLRPALSPAWWTDPGAGARRGLLAVWAGCVVVFFSLPQSKLVGYVLPALPALLLLLADAQSTGSHRAPRGWWWASAAGALLGVAVVAWLALHPARTTLELASALRARHADGEPVLLLGEYPFDFRLHARLAQPVQVIDSWSDPRTVAGDDWRKELLDAGRFAPARARAVLVEPQRLPEVLCRAPVNWLLGAADAAGRFAFLTHAVRVAEVRGQALWRLDTRGPTMQAALSCAGTPSAGSAGR